MSTVLIMLDGVRPDALEQANCANLKAFKAKSAYSMRATSVMPSMTLPCHMSIFHSVPPTRHGIITNDWSPMVRPLPGLVEVAFKGGKRCSFFYNWENLRDLSRPGHLEYSFFTTSGENRGHIDRDVDHRIAQHAATYIKTAQPDFAFVYFGTVDVAGHVFGWMEDGYLQQLEHIDAAFGDLMHALPDNATVLVQADHGGHDRTHGTEMPEDMLIPWMIAGPGIKEGHEIREDVSLLDTAPTLAKILGLEADAHWEGKIIQDVFM